jgi:hypothetical protein
MKNKENTASRLTNVSTGELERRRQLRIFSNIFLPLIAIMPCAYGIIHTLRFETAGIIVLAITLALIARIVWALLSMRRIEQELKARALAQLDDISGEITIVIPTSTSTDAPKRWPTWAKELISSLFEENKTIIGNIMAAREKAKELLKKGYHEDFLKMNHPGNKEAVQEELDRIECLQQRNKRVCKDIDNIPQDILEEKREAIGILEALLADAWTVEIGILKHRSKAPRVTFLFDEEEKEIRRLIDVLNAWQPAPDAYRDLIEKGEAYKSMIESIEKATTETVNGYENLREKSTWWKLKANFLHETLVAASTRAKTLEGTAAHEGMPARLANAKATLDDAEQLLIGVDQSCHQATNQTYSRAQHKKDLADFNAGVEKTKEVDRLCMEITVLYTESEEEDAGTAVE